jgi:ATP-binding cassette subfamily B (MDR/TAP) protein 1
MKGSKLEDTTINPPAPENTPRQQEEILNEQQIIPNTRVGFFHLYRDATRLELFILFVSAVLAIAGGAILPIMTVRLSLPSLFVDEL